jgi:hypothetical protein
MTIRSKMRLSEVAEVAGTVNGQKRLKFQSCYDQTIPEDQRFQQATPWAEATYLVDNPAALEQFKLGEYYYVDFSPVPKPEAPAQ